MQRPASMQTTVRVFGSQILEKMLHEAGRVSPRAWARRSHAATAREITSTWNVLLLDRHRPENTLRTHCRRMHAAV